MNTLNMRIIHTHDIQDNWDSENLKTFIPKAGEIIVYDIDNNHAYERFKIGDGLRNVKELPFTIDNVVEKIFNIQDKIIYADAGRITDYNTNSNVEGGTEV